MFNCNTWRKSQVIKTVKVPIYRGMDKDNLETIHDCYSAT